MSEQIKIPRLFTYVSQIKSWQPLTQEALDATLLEMKDGEMSHIQLLIQRMDLTDEEFSLLPDE